MITQYEVPSLLRQEIPQLVEKTYPSKVSLEIYTSIHSFIDFTRHAVEDHNLTLAKKCFALAGNLYRNGDRMVRLIIENSFIYSFSSLMPQDRIEKLIVKSMIPDSLYAVYLKQVMSSGC